MLPLGCCLRCCGFCCTAFCVYDDFVLLCAFGWCLGDCVVCLVNSVGIVIYEYICPLRLKLVCI